MPRTLRDVAAARAALRMRPRSNGRVHPQRVYDVADAIATARDMERARLIALATMHADKFDREGEPGPARRARFGRDLIVQLGRELDAEYDGD